MAAPAGGSEPRAPSMSQRLDPSTSSATTNPARPSHPTPCTMATFGWARPATAVTSRSSRVAKPRSSAYRRIGSLTATRRRSCRSHASNTSVMPPAPIDRTTS